MLRAFVPFPEINRTIRLVCMGQRYGIIYTSVYNLFPQIPRFILIIECLFFSLQAETNKLEKMSEIRAKVISIIVDKLNVEESEVTNEASFTNDLGADSLDTVELIMEFEKQFNISIPDDKAEGIQTVGDAITYIESNVG